MKKRLVLSMFLLLALLSACSSRAINDSIDPMPEPDMKAAEEANRLVGEAEKVFVNATAQMKAIFSESLGRDKLASIREKKPRFELAAVDFKKAKEQFNLASAKFKEAMNGKGKYDSPMHLKFSQLSDAYEKWSELAEVEFQLSQEAINIQDLNSFLANTGELEEKAKTLNDEVNKKIEMSRKTAETAK